MFQYALGCGLSLRHNAPLKIDSSYLRSPNQSRRSFLLDGLNVAAPEASADEIRAYRGTLQKMLDRFRPDLKKKTVLEKSFAFDPEILKRDDGYFDGHWQDERYFKGYEKKVRENFTLKNPFGREAEKMAARMAREPNGTSLHIRRGDYVAIKKITDRHGVLPLAYYKAACEKILENFPDARFFVSSDDILWAKEHFPKDYAVTFVSRPAIGDCEELALMSRCRHNIIANSTMSWWGAWLNQNPRKIVIAPKKWFVDLSRKTGLLSPNFITLQTL